MISCVSFAKMGENLWYKLNKTCSTNCIKLERQLKLFTFISVLLEITKHWHLKFENNK